MRFKWLLLLPCWLHATAGYFSPWGKDADLVDGSHRPIEHTKPSWGVLLATQVIHFHQTIISPVDGPRSHFRPSSSQYMLLAMQKHGFFQGFLMGCDRLMRENGDAWVYPQIEEEGQLFKYDPVR